MTTKIKFPCYMKQVNCLLSDDCPYVVVLRAEVGEEYIRYVHYHLGNDSSETYTSRDIDFVKVSKKEALAALVLMTY